MVVIPLPCMAALMPPAFVSSEVRATPLGVERVAGEGGERWGEPKREVVGVFFVGDLETKSPLLLLSSSVGSTREA